MEHAFNEKLEKLSLVASLHSDYAHLLNAFANIASRMGKQEEAEEIDAQASALRKESSRYGEMEIFYETRKDEIDSLDLDAILENLKEDVRTLAQNL